MTYITGGQATRIDVLELSELDQEVRIDQALKDKSPRSGFKGGTAAGSQLEMQKQLGTLVSRMEALEQMDSRSAGTQLLDEFDLLQGRLQILEAQVCVQYLTFF